MMISLYDSLHYPDYFFFFTSMVWENDNFFLEFLEHKLFSMAFKAGLAIAWGQIPDSSGHSATRWAGGMEPQASSEAPSLDVPLVLSVGVRQELLKVPCVAPGQSFHMIFKAIPPQNTQTLKNDSKWILLRKFTQACTQGWSTQGPFHTFR